MTDGCTVTGRTDPQGEGPPTQYTAAAAQTLSVCHLGPRTTRGLSTAASAPPPPETPAWGGRQPRHVTYGKSDVWTQPHTCSSLERNPPPSPTPAAEWSQQPHSGHAADRRETFLYSQRAYLQLRRTVRVFRDKHTLTGGDGEQQPGGISWSTASAVPCRNCRGNDGWFGPDQN